MRTWAEIYDAAGNRLGDGPITTVDAISVRKMLDGAGTISFTVPASNPRVAELIEEERRFRLYVQVNNAVRELGRGIIRNVNYSETTAGARLSITGPDDLDELKRVSVVARLEYDDQEFQAIASDLVSRVSGWSADCSVTEKLTARLDAVSVLKGLQEVTRLQGLHFRKKPDSSEVEVGAFGESAEVVLLNTNQMTSEAYNNDGIALIENIQQTTRSEQIVNRAFVLGAGANIDSSLTLERSTRTSPYTIQTRTINGTNYYYIEDAASVAQYGAIERVIQFREIAPLSNNPVDEELAANALYDAAAAWLQRHATAQVTYNVVVRKLRRLLQPGQKIRVVYKDPIQRIDQTIAPPRNIDSEFWILSVQETVSTSGASTQVEVAEIDRFEDDTARRIIGSLDQVRINNLQIQPTFNHYLAGPEQVQIDPSNSGRVDLTLTDAVFRVNRILMRVRTQRFTSTTQAAASGGGNVNVTLPAHSHKLFEVSGAATPPAANRYCTMFDGSGYPIFGFFTSATPYSSIYTYEAGGAASVSLPNHTHPLTYGIYRDGQRPGTLTIRVNGVNVTSKMSNRGSTGADLDETIDITEEIVGKAGGFQGTHTVDIFCAAGRGEVLVTFDVYEIITPVKINTS